MNEKGNIKQNDKIKVGNTTIVIKRTFGTMNLNDIFSDYVAKVISEKASFQIKANRISA